MTISLTEAQHQALEWLASTATGGAFSTSIPEKHFRSLSSLKRLRVGRRKLVSEKTGLGGGW